MIRISLLLIVLLTACTGQPQGVTAVSNFELQRYLGKWYEIARLDHSFERGLTKVTAEYLLREDGGVRVINRGYDTAKNQWREAEGKAYFVSGETTGHLKVSFFGPFYGSYIVFELDQENYQYALISGPDKSYLWLLARTPDLKPDKVQQLINKAKALGFATETLIFVEH